MKKLAALLLALLLPLTAMADTYCAEMHVSVNEEEFTAAFLPLIDSMMEVNARDVNAEAIVSTLARLMDGLGLQLRIQPDAFSMDFLLSDSSLLDLAFHPGEDQVLMVSDLMPGYALGIEVEELDETIEQAFAELDWVTILQSTANGWNTFVTRVEYTEETGAFSGDAYADGAVCSTWMLDDSDIAAFVNAFMSPELQAAVTPLLTACDLDSEVIFETIITRSEEVAAANQHSYILRLVEDDEGDPVGASLVVFRDGDPIGTASLGLKGDGLRLVVGLGMNDMNYWHEQDITVAVAEDVLTLAGTMNEFTAPKDEAYAYARAHAAEMVSQLSWQCSITARDSGLAWEYFLEGNTVSNTTDMSERSIGKGSLTYEPFTLTNALTEYLGDNELLTIDLSVAPSDPITAYDPSLTVCNASSTDEAELALYDEIMELFNRNLTVRMIKLLPLDTILSIPNLINVP